ncbi:hypothetical protein IQ266_25750 [filamentous cyanobacterium LEGE 11480]|uniref:Uncharacterized protein n=1 Tax=Romeriopsis navalis LEGE 11480 TaxID=2777977 RepID=A0A928VSX6_9CYAN|nr:hypothetical protein [Romeriopsis navalis LEGE 11480]
MLVLLLGAQLDLGDGIAVGFQTLNFEGENPAPPGLGGVSAAVTSTTDC